MLAQLLIQFQQPIAIRPSDATLNSSATLFNSLNETTNQLASLNRSVRAANALVTSSVRDNPITLIWTNDFHGSIDEDIGNFGQQWNAGWFCDPKNYETGSLYIFSA